MARSVGGCTQFEFAFERTPAALTFPPAPLRGKLMKELAKIRRQVARNAKLGMQGLSLQRNEKRLGVSTVVFRLEVRERERRAIACGPV